MTYHFDSPGAALRALTRPSGSRRWLVASLATLAVLSGAFVAGMRVERARHERAAVEAQRTVDEQLRAAAARVALVEAEGAVLRAEAADAVAAAEAARATLSQATARRIAAERPRPPDLSPASLVERERALGLRP